MSEVVSRIVRQARVLLALERLIVRQHRLEAAIAAVPALTATGQAAKARAVQLRLGLLRAPPPGSQHGLVWSLAADLLRGAAA